VSAPKENSLYNSLVWVSKLSAMFKHWVTHKDIEMVRIDSSSVNLVKVGSELYYVVNPLALHCDYFISCTKYRTAK